MDNRKLTYEELENRVEELERLLSVQNTKNINCGNELVATNYTLDSLKIQVQLREDLFNEFLQHCPIYVFFKDSDIRILHLSKNYEKMLGIPSENLIGKTMDEIFPPELAKSMIADDLKTIREGKIIEIEESLNGRNYYTQKFPIHINNKAYLSGYTIDITERKQREELIKQNAKDLQELNATKDKLFSIIAHDLRSPFSVILSFSEILMQNIDLYSNEDTKKMIGHIYSSAKNTYNLLINLLDWAKTQLNLINANIVAIDISVLIKNSITDLEIPAQNKNVSLKCTIPNNTIIHVDINMMSAVFRNLISNAIKYSNSGDTVQIIVKATSENIECSISDTGIGMSPETSAKIFSSTIIESISGTKNEKGTGLGLIICKEFIEKHGGRIKIDSKLGQGSIFSFNLPTFNANKTK